jgi:protein-L-isoaspartate(D-aspartate) O-methyltransferase
MKTDDQRRAEMVERDIARRGVRDERVLAAMRAVPRAAFVPAHLRERALDDRPLPIGEGQTISQPYIVALMVEALRLHGGERVLEIGTGSGYAAAVLARLCARVDSVERIEALAAGAEARLAGLGVANVRVHCADGTLGWPEGAPYDAILVSAGGPRVPPALESQLAPGGRLVMPVGRGRGLQDLLRLTRDGGTGGRTESLAPVVFVPLVGAQGWPRP